MVPNRQKKTALPENERQSRIPYGKGMVETFVVVVVVDVLIWIRLRLFHENAA